MDDDNNDNNLNNPRPISKLTLGDVLNIDKTKRPHSNPFFRFRLLTPKARFFRNSRPLLSKLHIRDKKPRPSNNSFVQNPQPPGVTLGVVLNGDKKTSHFRSPRSLTKISLNNVFNRTKKPPLPLNNPPQPVSKLSLGVAFDSDKKPPPPPPTNKYFFRSLLANVGNNDLKVPSGLNKKSWKSSSLCRRLHLDDPFHGISNSNQNQNQDEDEDEDQNQNQDQDQDIDMEWKSLATNSIGSDYSPRWSDTCFVTKSSHEDFALREVDGEWSLKSSGDFNLPMEVVAKKEKTQRKFSRELFVLWCLFVGCLSFLIFSFFCFS